MRGAVFVGVDRDLELTDVEPVGPGPSDVVVAIGASGVCHSDLSVVTGARPFPAPALLGHEAAGTVVEVGADVRLVRVGDRVVTGFIPSCGRCFWCLRGESNLCQLAADVATVPRATLPDGRTATAFLGLGTFAERITVHEASLVPVRSDLPDDQLALLGCGVTTGICAVLRTARVEPGDTVAVLGCGGVGQAVVQGAKLAGAARIVAVDPVGWKRDIALSLGATDAVDPTTTDVREAVLAGTGGRGVDHAFEATGLPAVTRQALTVARRGGAVIMLGMPAFDAVLEIPALPLFAEGKRVVAGKYGDAQVRRDVQRLIELAEAGRIDLASMVTRRVGLADVNEALRAMTGGEVIRSVIV
ncbi:Zn-dependent alcohol dehydrogenase [Rhizomonospora bruguierae]|uniref:Zn-dependent alcohol dehydrogenase n=1 Tax=Rhizomonospora bruguierae TaxID=1581705 RepID=UPI001BCBD129|nr:Zn-dependent alcohol dehydrogenase [Micromonospora sp. NBRC 107566]